MARLYEALRMLKESMNFMLEVQMALRMACSLGLA